MPFCDVAIATPVHTAFTYRVPEGMTLEPGMRVLVPFHRRRVAGICIGIGEEAPASAAGRELKSIAEKLDDAPSLAPSLLQLVRWMAAYYCAPIGEACRAALPARMLAVDGPRTTRPTAPTEIEPFIEPRVTLNDGQREALAAIIASLAGARPPVFLLEGITGSGKTEVYLRFFEELITRGKQGLLLVPEIGLTPQLTGRAVARFGSRVAVYHSGLTDAQRHAQWLRMKNGEADIVIGTRSALFAPLPKLGAIVVDEEHDGSYKQDDGVPYHGRDGAVMRAHIEEIPVVLGSATPSLESLENARRGKYTRLRLVERPTGSPLPEVEIIDMRARVVRRAGEEQSEGTRRKRELGALSPALFDAIGETLARNEQILLFTGRRGFAGALQCDTCGEPIRCPNCDIALTLHGARGRKAGSGKDAGGGFVLACHYCDYAIPEPASCPACNAPSLFPIGHGTERLEAELADFFPQARVARFDSDSAGSSPKRQKILADMRRGRIDILVGTQMVTKGHDFPGVTLVGVVAADVTLALPDFRATERTFQLLTQVAGRAGRGDQAGRVIIQTRQPEHASFAAAREHDIGAFAATELEHRRELSYPPFARLANVRISSTSEAKAEKAATEAAAIAARVRRSLLKAGGPSDASSLTLLGPALAPFAKLRGRHRWQLLVKAASPGALSAFVSRLRPALAGAFPSGVRCSIDVDPVTLL